MQVNDLNIYTDGENNLLLQKRKRRLVKDIIYLIVFTVLIATIATYFLSTKKIGLFEKPGVGFIVLLIIFFLISMIITNLRISIKNATDYYISIKGSGIYINDKFFSSYQELDSIIVQGTNGWDGIGESFVVGLLANNKFFPLSFYHSNKDAQTIAEFLSNYFKKQIEIKKSKTISLFKGY